MNLKKLVSTGLRTYARSQRSSYKAPTHAGPHGAVRPGTYAPGRRRSPEAQAAGVAMKSARRLLKKI